ncbi:MAG TPA: RNA polymerase sigma factor [Thermoleophilaceae bacterium]|jgi:RNA polymerase sigma-70 factor (ECF subfamily)
MVVDELRPTEQDLGAGPRTGRFRRRTTLVDSDEQRRLISRAVARAKAGDQEAIRFIYIRYADNVYGYVRSIVRDEHEAEDVTQHVFAKLLKNIVKYEERSVPFSAWILRVARNVAVDHMRRSRAVPCEEVRGLDEIDESGESDRLQSLSDALLELPEDQRSVLMLRHLVGLTPGEIAEELGRSEASVHGLHHRGRRALQRELADVGLAPATAA